MNIDKVEELAKKIYGVKVTKNPLGNPMYEFTGTELAMFAELMVKECADFIAPLGDWCGGHGEPRMPSTSECAKKLKEHFGVEE